MTQRRFQSEYLSEAGLDEIIAGGKAMELAGLMERMGATSQNIIRKQVEFAALWNSLYTSGALENLPAEWYGHVDWAAIDRQMTQGFIEAVHSWQDLKWAPIEDKPTGPGKWVTARVWAPSPESKAD